MQSGKQSLNGGRSPSTASCLDVQPDGLIQRPTAECADVLSFLGGAAVHRTSPGGCKGGAI